MNTKMMNTPSKMKGSKFEQNQPSPDSIAAPDAARIIILSSSPTGMEISVDTSLLQEWENAVTENDPVVAFCWSENLPRAVDQLNIDLAPIPAWALPVLGGYPITSGALKLAILQCCQAVTAGGVVDSFVIAPNTLVEYGAIVTRLTEMQLDPFIREVANLCGDYIARIHLFMDSTPRLTSTLANIPAPMNLGGGNVQAFV